MKKKLLSAVCCTFIIMLLLACAKREPDISPAEEGEQRGKLISITELNEYNGKKVNESIGEEGNQMIIDAQVMIPEKIMKGKVEGTLPPTSEIEKYFCGGQKMKEVDHSDEPEQGMIEWEIAGKNGSADKLYAYDEHFALYTNGLVEDQGVTGNLDTENAEIDDAKLDHAKDMINEIMDGLHYDVKETCHQVVTEDSHYHIVVNYMVVLEGVPVVDPYVGIDYTHAEIKDGVISQMGYAKNYKVINSEETKILPLDELVKQMKNSYENGTLQIIQETVNQIGLMYYVDEKDDLIPVWVFLADSFNDGRESVVAFFDASTGGVLYDEMNGKVSADE